MSDLGNNNNNPSRFWERLPYLLFALVVLLFAANAFSLLGFPLDDAWIHRVYARSFAFGHGFAYNPGQQEAGSTSPLWSMVSAPAEWLGLLGTDAVVIAVKLIGVALALLSIHAVRKIGLLFFAPSAASIAAGLFALDPRLVFAALSGMESVLLVALWLWSTYALLSKRPWLACALMSLTPTARPESLLVLPFFALAFLLVARQAKFSRRQLSACLLLPLPMLAWGLFCRSANGHWLPTTFYIKNSEFRLGLSQLQQAWAAIGHRGLLPATLVFVAVAVLLVACMSRFRQQVVIVALLGVLAPATYILGVVCGRNFLFDGYYWTRWVEPPALLLASASGLGCAALLGSWRMSLPKWLPQVLVAGLLVVALPHFWSSMTAQRFHLVNDSRATNLVNVAAGKWIERHTRPDAWLAINDAGAIRYFGKRPCIDLIGLNHAEIAFQGANPNMLARADWFVIFPSWFGGSSFMSRLQPVETFSIPPEEYTICRATDQALMVAYKARR